MIQFASNKDHQTTNSWPLWLTIILAVGAFLAWPARHAPIILDDIDAFTHVATFSHWTDVFKADAYGLFRPVKTAVFHLFAPQESVDLTTWHSLILAAFLGSIGAVFALLRVLLRSDAGALTGAAIWGLTPTQSSLAVWMSCINISICVIFIAVFLILHLRASRKGNAMNLQFVLAGLTMFLAQASYETAVACAGLAFLADELTGDRRPIKQRLAPYGLYAAITFAFLIIRVAVGSNVESHGLNLGFDPEIAPWQQSVSSAWFLQKHLVMWLAPLGRVEFASTYLWGKSASSIELTLAWIGVILLLAASWFCRKRLPLFTFGVLWFFATALPSSNLIPIAAGPIEDYYLVIPSIGLVISLIALLQALLSRLFTPASQDEEARLRPAVLLALGALLLWRASLIPFFGMQAAVWNDPLQLYLRCAETRSHQFQAQGLAARELLHAQRFEEAAILAEASFKDGPWQPTSGLILGLTKRHFGDEAGALKLFQHVVEQEKEPTASFQAASLEIAKIQAQEGEPWETSRAALIPILQHGSPDYRIKAIHLLARIYDSNDLKEKAVQTLERGVAEYPNHTPFVSHLNDITR